MNRKYIGFDKRAISLVGVIALFASTIYWWQYRWADGLLFGAFLLLGVFFILAAYDVWKEDKSTYEKRQKETIKELDEKYKKEKEDYERVIKGYTDNLFRANSEKEDISQENRKLKQLLKEKGFQNNGDA